MSNAESVKRLKQVRACYGMILKPLECAAGEQAVIDAITALSSQDDVRDRALEEAANVADGFTCGGCGMDGKVGRAIRALKSKTATSTADDTEAQRQSWLRGEMAMGGSVAGTKPWTRADGTTSPVRGKVEDRRKSEFGNPERAPGGQGRRYYNGSGRRANDHARWTQPPAPECGHEEGDSEYGGRGICVKCGSPWHVDCPPAPEVKGQSLVDEWAAYRVNIDWERPATMLDLKIAMRAVGDELDTRLGEKS